MLRKLGNQVLRLQRRIDLLEALNRRFVGWRTLAFVGGLIAALAAFNIADWVGYSTLVLWGIGFGVLVAYHRRVQMALARFITYRDLKRRHIARIRLDWDLLPVSDLTVAQTHPFAHDLDLVGEFSLHRLLDTAIAYGGSARLLEWMTAPAPDAALLRERQALVQELAPLVNFRDKLALEASLAGNHGRWEGDRLLRWLNDETQPEIDPRTLLLLAGLALVNAVLVVLDAANVLPPFWMASMTVYASLSAQQLRKQGDLFQNALTLQSELRHLQAVLSMLENYPYGPHRQLAALCAVFQHTRPSTFLRRIARIASAASLQRNVIVWFILNVSAPWDIFFAYRLQQNKHALAEALPKWLDTWYELEALNSLANFAYLNPGFVFPTFSTDLMTFQGVRLGHPLIPAERRVCNDFGVEQRGETVIITGSNMSGKSSFLRTVGVNMCLAYAGSVACAESLTLSRFRLYTSITVSDSVIYGVSFFYAEVRRLKALLTALQMPGALPLFYLIDEIFRGTNNRERLIGSRSYIHALVGSHGCGLISTHDLELVRLADEMPRIRNLHFREEVVEGQMIFDYQLRRGPSPTTNALKIMQLEGLPVDHD